MSDQELRKVLQDVMEEIDSGRLRPLRPKRLRGTLRGAILAAALGLSTAACGGRAVGGDPDAGTQPHPDVATQQLDAGTQQPDAATVQLDAGEPQVDSGPLTAYGIPEVDAGTVVLLDGGATNLYLAVMFDGGDVEALDAGPQPAEDAEIDTPAYMAPPVPRSSDDSDDPSDTE
jgi:hypothetical protein